MPDWFVVNVADAPAKRGDRDGAWVKFEPEDGPEFPQFGLNVQVLWPGQPNCAYHAENLQEDFLVVAGECIAIVEEQERRLKAWDFVHCPPGTRHVFIGAGDGPCTIVMVGARRPDEELLYPLSELAARYGAQSVNAPTDGPGAYEGWPPSEPIERLPWPPPAEPV
jgi:quercetin dioxygenase-like cupin family protein